MKNLPQIVFALITVATLYACNKKEEREAMNISSSSRYASDTLHGNPSDTLLSWPLDTTVHDTIVHSYPVDTTWHTNPENPYDTIWNNNPYDTVWNNNPYDTIRNNNPYDTVWNNNPYDTIWSPVDSSAAS